MRYDDPFMQQALLLFSAAGRTQCVAHVVRCGRITYARRYMICDTIAAARDTIAGPSSHHHYD